ncbi:MAG: 50S ribosomal protein L13 [Candidatus Pacebacteria bacterium]|jgi:large subunit ribosomal protein L13|nr:50S ribosomal protein L13 [Candidatus Paceibacterota bacterium]
MKYTIDAAGKNLGRVATEIATALRGKLTPDFAPNVKPKNTVTVTNAAQINISAKKAETTYANYSGYPGGLKLETRGHLRDRRGIQEVLVRTVSGMLPKNKLRSLMLKNLTINE